MYKRHRFPPEIIQHAVWLYYRFNLSHRDIENLLAVRGIVVCDESVRMWCNKFGPKYARRLKRRHQGFGDTSFIDEVFVKIDGIQHYIVASCRPRWRSRRRLFTKSTRVRERGMRRFKSMQQAQRFLTVHAAVYNLFNLGRHLVSAKNYRFFRLRAFASWNCAAA